MEDNTKIRIQLLASLRDTEGYKNWMRDKVENSATPWREYIEALLKFNDFPKNEGHGFTKEQAELFDEYMYSFVVLFTEQYHEGEPQAGRLRDFVDYLMYESRYINVGEKLAKAYAQLMAQYKQENKENNAVKKEYEIPVYFTSNFPLLSKFLNKYGFGKVIDGKFNFNGSASQYAFLVEKVTRKFWDGKAREINKFAELEDYFIHPKFKLESARNKPQEWHKHGKYPKRSKEITLAVNFKDIVNPATMH